MSPQESRERSEHKQKTFNTTYELFIIILSLYSIVVVVLATLFPIRETTIEILILVDHFVVVIFLYDFIRQLYRAPSKLAYLKWGWMDLLSSIPGLYLFRLFRIGRIIRSSNQFRAETGRSIWEEFKNNRADSGLLMTTFSILFLLIFTSIMVLSFESESPQNTIQTPEDAVWWSFVTLTTVGYGDEVPTTSEGRLIAFILMGGGMVLLAVFTAYAVSYFNPKAGREEEILLELQEEIAEMKLLLAKLEDLPAITGKMEDNDLDSSSFNVDE